jgi:hypothetical protein
MVDTFGEWVRLKQAHGDFVLIRASLVSSLGETGGESGQVKTYVATVNNQTYVVEENPFEVVGALRKALQEERRLAR